MKRKGFTLIELLAVIVILAVIALIATPLIMNVINDAKKNSFKDSVYGIIKAIEIRVAEEQIYNIDGQNVAYRLDLGKDHSAVSYSGELPDEGWAYVDVNGNIELYVTKGEWCAYKNASTGINVELSEDVSVCTTAMTTISSNTEVYTLTSNGIESPCGGNALAPVSFATDSWGTINQAALCNNLSTYHVGDTKTISLDVDEDGTPEEYHIMVVNTTACTTETSETACGLVLQFQELLKTKEPVNKTMNLSSTNAGGWPATAMRTYLNETVYPKLTLVMGGIIKDTTVISGVGGRTLGNYTSTDKLYLLSTKEVGLNMSEDKVQTETRKLDYYVEGDDSAARALRIKTEQGASSGGPPWWLRSAYYSSSYDFSAVHYNGSSTIFGAATAIGIAPAFRVGNSGENSYVANTDSNETYKGILYLDPTDLGIVCTEELAAANKRGQDESGNPTLTGTKSGCMKWFTFGDDGNGNPTTAILDHNTTAITIYDFSNKNSQANGRVENTYEASWQLAQDISNWDNRLSARFPTADEMASAGGISEFDEVTSTSGGYLGGGNSASQNGKYWWLYTNLYYSENYNGQGNDSRYYRYYSNETGARSSQHIYGYWTSTPFSGADDRLWHVDNIGTLFVNNIASSARYGVRPVISLASISLPN